MEAIALIAITIALIGLATDRAIRKAAQREHWNRRMRALPSAGAHRLVAWGKRGSKR